MDRARLAAIVIGLLFAACGSKSAKTPDGGGGAGADAMGAAGQTGAAGAELDASGAAGAAGTSGAAGADAATVVVDGAGDSVDGADGNDGNDDAPGDADASAEDGGADASDGGAAILAVVPTKGCGTDPGFVTGTAVIDTMGVKDAKCADLACGPWMYVREYYVRLPANYDKNKVYPLVFEPISCGGKGLNYTQLSAFDDTLIRVGMTPPPNEIGHSTNPNQGCPDNAEGDDSVEWNFYEKLYDRLAERTCFDKNRVFFAGIHHGATMADQFACKYAGDPTRPVRGILSDSGGLFPSMIFQSTFQHVPTCSNTPIAGIWMDPTGNTTIPFTFAIEAINRAMKVNGCTIGTGFLDAEFEPFPIGGNQPDNTCKLMKGCPALSPIVVCAIQTNNSTVGVGIRAPGFMTFLKLFESPMALGPPP
jgi:hypothetical protein